MKNIICNLSLLFMLLCVFNCNAQNYHREDPNADKFEGSWKWGNNVNGLTLIMKKENNLQILNNDTDRFDMLLGFHKIYKNGVLAEDTTLFSNSNFVDSKQSFVASTEDGNPNLLVVFMTHKDKNIRMKISYLDSTHIKIIEVKNQEGVRFILPGEAPTDWSIDILNNIILTKQ